MCDVQIIIYAEVWELSKVTCKAAKPTDLQKCHQDWDTSCSQSGGPYLVYSMPVVQSGFDFFQEHCTLWKPELRWPVFTIHTMHGRQHLDLTSGAGFSTEISTLVLQVATGFSGWGDDNWSTHVASQPDLFLTPIEGQCIPHPHCQSFQTSSRSTLQAAPGWPSMNQHSCSFSEQQNGCYLGRPEKKWTNFMLEVLAKRHT